MLDAPAPDSAESLAARFARLFPNAGAGGGDALFQWDFFQALRQIECEFREYARLGTSTTLAQDPVRLGQFISMDFASSTLARPHAEAAQAETTAGGVPKMLVRFTGLTGPNGPLPLVITEFIRNRLRGIVDPDMPPSLGASGSGTGEGGDPALAEFIDLFHHRLITLLYRAWAVARKTVDFDRHDQPGEPRYFTEWGASLFGHGLPEFDGLDSIPTWQKVAFAGHFAMSTRPLAGLRALLAGAFATGSEVTPLVGHWVKIPRSERCRLGRARSTGTVGKTLVFGSRFWDRRQKFTVCLGPMPFSEYVTFLPGGRNRQRLHDWIAAYTRREFTWAATIVPRRAEVPRLRLGARLQLGRTSWVASRQLAADPPDYRVQSPPLQTV